MEYIIYGAITTKRADLGPIQASSNYKQYQEVFNYVYNMYLNPLQDNRNLATDNREYLMSLRLNFNNNNYRVAVLYVKSYTNFPDQNRNFDRKEVYILNDSNTSLLSQINFLKKYSPKQYDAINLQGNPIVVSKISSISIDLSITNFVFNKLKSDSTFSLKKEDAYSIIDKIPLSISRFLNLAFGINEIIKIVPAPNVVEDNTSISFTSNSTKLQDWILQNIDSLSISNNFDNINDLLDFVTSFYSSTTITSEHIFVIIELLRKNKINESNSLAEILSQKINGNIDIKSIDYRNDLFIHLANEENFTNLLKLKLFSDNVNEILKVERFLKYKSLKIGNAKNGSVELIKNYLVEYLGDKIKYSDYLNDLLSQFLSTTFTSKNNRKFKKTTFDNVIKYLNADNIELSSLDFIMNPEFADQNKDSYNKQKKSLIQINDCLNNHFLISDTDTKEFILSIYNKEEIIELIENYNIKLSDLVIKEWILKNLFKPDLQYFIKKKDDVESIISSTDDYKKVSANEAIELENNFKNIIDELSNSRFLLKLFSPDFSNLLSTYLDTCTESDSILFQRIKNPLFSWSNKDVKQIFHYYKNLKNNSSYTSLFKCIDNEFANYTNNPKRTINILFTNLPLMKKFNEASILSKKLRLGSIFFALIGIMGICFTFYNFKLQPPPPPTKTPTTTTTTSPQIWRYRIANVTLEFKADNYGMLDTNIGFFSDKKLNNDIKVNMKGINLSKLRLYYPSKNLKNILYILPSDSIKNSFFLVVDLKKLDIKKDTSLSNKICKYISNDSEKSNSNDTVFFYKYSN